MVRLGLIPMQLASVLGFGQTFRYWTRSKARLVPESFRQGRRTTMHTSIRTVSVEAEAVTSVATLSRRRVWWKEPFDEVGCRSDHHLQLSLLPQGLNSRVCFPEHWGPRRFERVGNVFLFPANQVLHAKSDCSVQESIVCRLRTDALEQWFEDGLAWTNRRLEGSVSIGHGEIKRLLIRAGQELRSPGFAAEVVIELLAAQIVVELSRYLHGTEQRPASGRLTTRRLRLIDEYLSECPGKVSLPEIAKLCGLSVRQLSRAFFVSRDCSIGTYISESRIERARRLLVGGQSIKAISISLGFSSPANFSTTFRRVTGESPREFRSRVERI
jgi:AraC family transcriptional regulator